MLECFQKYEIVPILLLLLTTTSVCIWLLFFRRVQLRLIVLVIFGLCQPKEFVRERWVLALGVFGSGVLWILLSQQCVASRLV